MGRRYFRQAGGERQKGATAVEFAVVAMLFLTVVTSILELGILFFVNLTMQHAVREGARYAITGQSDLDPNTANQKRYLAVIEQIKRNSMGYYDQLSPTIVVAVNGGTPTSYGTSASYSSGMFGGPGDIVVLQLNCSWPLITPVWQALFSRSKYDFSVATTMRNEAFH